LQNCTCINTFDLLAQHVFPLQEVAHGKNKVEHQWAVESSFRLSNKLLIAQMLRYCANSDVLQP